MSAKKSGFLPIDVIKAVKERPGIYNKEALIAPRREHRQQLWVEVAESVTPAEEWEMYTQEEKETRVYEVSNKWKNLRDHFYRDVKVAESDDTHKKRKYVYYDDMEFVRPYIGYKMPPRNKRPRRTCDSLNSSQEYKLDDSDIDMNDFLKPNKYIKKEESPINETVTNKTKPALKRKRVSAINSSKKPSAREVGINNFHVLKKMGDSNNPTFKIRESDISFCLSLVPTLRELLGARKLSAKIDILKVLHKHLDEVERNHDDNDYEEYEQSDESVYYDKRDPLNESGNRKLYRK